MTQPSKKNIPPSETAVVPGGREIAYWANGYMLGSSPILASFTLLSELLGSAA